MKVSITGAWERDLKIEDIDFGAMTPQEHKRVIHKLSPHIYEKIPGWVVTGLGNEDCTLEISREKYGEVEKATVLDFQSMYSVHNFGYRNKMCRRIVSDIAGCLLNPYAPKAIPRAQDHLYHAPALSAITKFTGLDSVILKSTGAEAVETACNIASLYWNLHRKQGADKKPTFIAAKNSFHGRTRFARSLSDNPSLRKNFDPLFTRVYHVPFGDIFELKRILNTLREKTAAFIVEPIQGEGGVVMPPKNYLYRVAKLCKEFGVPLILDEIQTGFGRTGTDWAYERYGILPDILCGGKADGGGVMPVSFVAGKKAIFDCLTPGSEGATWSATPIQCIAITAAIREVSLNNLSRKAEEKGRLLFSCLKHLKERIFPGVITDIRGSGLFVGIDTIFNAKKVSLALLEEGVWAKETGQPRQDGTMKTVRLSPPLTVSDEQIRQAVLAFESVLKKMKGKYRSVR